MQNKFPQVLFAVSPIIDQIIQHLRHYLSPSLASNILGPRKLSNHASTTCLTNIANDLSNHQMAVLLQKKIIIDVC